MTTTWTSVLTSTNTPWSSVVTATAIQGATIGSPMGMLLAITYATAAGGSWSNVTQPSGTVWTSVLVAT